MPVSNTTCPRCGADSSTGRIWCQSCAAPIPGPALGLNVYKDQKCDRRTRFYQQILEDLGELRDGGTETQQTYDLIHGFYSRQLVAAQRQQAKLKQDRALNHQLINARKAAHHGRFAESITLLRQIQTTDQGGGLVGRLIAEISQRKDDQEQAARAARKAEREAREAESLHHAARKRLSDGKLDEAKERLQHALRLVPEHSACLAMLEEVNTQLALAAKQLFVEEPKTHEGDPGAAQAAEAARTAEAAQVAEAAQAAEAIQAAEATQAAEAAQVAEATQVAEAAQVAEVAQVAEAVQVAEEPELVASISMPAESHLQSKTSFEDTSEVVSNPTDRLVDAASTWSSAIKPFLLDNVGWFVGAFLVVAGFIVLIVTFRTDIEQNRVLMHSLVYFSLTAATGIFFATAYFMRTRHPQLESSSNALLVIVALLIPLVFAAAMLTSLVPVSPPDAAIIQNVR